MSYYQHKIYCDLDYKTLLSIAAGYFESLQYYNSDGELFKNNKKIYRDNSESLSFGVAAARSFFDTSENVFIISKNLKGKLSRKEMAFEDLPLRVRQRFKNMPNVLEVDLSLRLYSYQYNLVISISNKLKEAGYTVYDDSFNGQLLGIYETHTESEVEKVESIHSLVREYFNQNNLPSLELNVFSAEISLMASNLESDSLLALKTAEYLRNIAPELPDYSPIVIEYCKIIEIEIYHKILLPIRSRMVSQPVIITSKSLQKLKTFVLSNENKSIELGTFSAMLESVIKNKISDDLAHNLMDTVLSLPFKRNAEYLIKDIFYLTRNFRNKAAHKSILNEEDMNACRDFVIGNNEKIGLLGKIVNIA